MTNHPLYVLFLHVSLALSSSVSHTTQTRLLYANINWGSAQYYTPSTAVVLGTKLYYFTKGPDQLYFTEFDSVTRTWRPLTPYSWLTDLQGWDMPMRYESIRIATASSLIYVYGRGETGTCLSAFNPATEVWTLHPQFPFLRDVDGFTAPQYYRTVRLIAIGSVLYLFARSASDILLSSYDTAAQTWTLHSSPGAFTNDSIWSVYMYYSTFKVASQGSTIWLYGRGPAGINLISYNTLTGTWGLLRTYVYFQDSGQWGNPQFFETSALLVLNNVVYISARGIANVYTVAYNPTSNVFAITANLPYYTDGNGWNQPQYYFSLKEVTCNNAIYTVGRGPSAVYAAAYTPNAWVIQTSNPGYMTDAAGWNTVNSYKSVQLLCIGNSLYYAGRRGSEVTVSSFSAGAWSAAVSYFAPCYNTCFTCNGDTFSACLSCFAGSTLQGPAPNACGCPSHMYLDTVMQGCRDCHPRCDQCTAGLNTNCSACQANSVLNGSKCDCLVGFYWEIDNICTKCPSTCTQCDSPILCVSCISNAVLSTGICICSQGYYYSQSLTKCALCDSSCLECVESGPFSCSKCRFGANLLTIPASACACNLGFFPLDHSTCQACDSLCLTCDGPTPSSCLSCPNGSGLTANRACECIFGFYRLGGMCIPCDQTCQRCKGPLETDCLACWNNATLQNSGICSCNIGFFPAPTSDVCEACPALCLSCSSSLICLTCMNNAGLDTTNICKCNPRYYDNNGKCEECMEGCGKCSNSACSECLQGWVLYTNRCVRTCPNGWETQLRACIPSPLHAYLTNLPSNLLTLGFSQALIREISTSDFAISVFSDAGSSSEPIPALLPVIANQTYNISLHFPEFPPDNSTLSLVFLSPSNIITETGQKVVENRLNVPLFPYTTTISAVSAAATAATQGSVASIASISLLTGNPTTLFGLISQLQLVTYIPLLSLNMPKDVIDTLAGLNSNTFIYSPFSGVFISRAEAAVPSKLQQRYGFSSTLFLANSNSMLLAALGLAISYIIVSGLARFPGFPVISAYFSVIKERYRWGYPVQWWLQVYMDVGINALLQFSTISSFNFDIVLLFNAFLAGIFLLFFIISPFLVMKMLNDHKNTQIARLGVLYSGLKPEIRLYFPLYLFRRLVYALLLLNCSDYPSIQAISSTVIAILTLCYLLVARPYLSHMALLSPVIAETSASSTLVLVSLFLLISKDSSIGKRVGQAVIAVVMSGVAACAVIAVVQLIATGKEVINTFRRIKAEMKAAEGKAGQTEIYRRGKIAF